MRTLAGVTLVTKPTDTFRKFLLQLLRDEGVAFIVSTLATALVFYAIQAWWGADTPRWVLIAAMIVSGPFLEKGAFLVPYLIIAWGVFKKDGGERWYINYWRYIRPTLKAEKFLRVLRADLCYHDSFYGFFVFVLTLAFGPQTGAAAWLISAFAFGAAVWIASHAEILFVQLQFQWFLRRIQRLGAKREHYGELRNLLGEVIRPGCFLAAVRDEYSLGEEREDEMADWAVRGAILREYNDWKGYAQVRRSGGVLNLHLVYWRTRKIDPQEDGLDGFTYIEKIKCKLALQDASIEAVRKALGPLAAKVLGDDSRLEQLFSCTRTYASNPGTVSFAYDVFAGEEGLGLLEIKFWLEALETAAEARIYPGLLHRFVVATTQPRSPTPSMLQGLLALKNRLATA